MYNVTAIIRFKDGNSVLIEGIYVPKEGVTPGEKIRKQCSDHVRSRIKVSKFCTKEEREQIEIEIKYTKLKDQFIVMEDK